MLQDTLDTIVDTESIQAVYTQAIVKGAPLHLQSRTDWSIYAGSTVPVLTANYVPVSVRMYSIPSLNTEISANSSVKICDSDLDKVLSIVNMGSLDRDIECDGEVWSISGCDSALDASPSYCVGCGGDKCNANCNITGFGLFPTASDCDMNSVYESGTYHVNYIRALVVTYRPPLPAPGVSSIDANPGESNVSLTVTLDEDSGTVYCQVYASGESPTSGVIVQASNHMGVAVNGTATVSIYGLQASTTYDAVCVTVSIEDVIMTDTVFLAQSMQAFATECCKDISVDVAMSSIQTGEQFLDAFELKLNALPATSADLTLTFSLNGVDGSSDLFVPSSVVFTSASNLLPVAVSFTGTSVAGDTELLVSVSGNESANFAVVYPVGHSVSVSRSFVPPGAPVMLSTTFASNGAYVVIAFDSATNRNGVVSGSFDCCSLFNFSSCSSSTCYWGVDGKQVTAYLGKDSDGSYLNAGDDLSVVEDILLPACTVTEDVSNCSTWDKTVATTVVVDPPAVPVNPVVAISAPTVIGSCLPLTIALSSSTGNGGRAWAGISFEVTSAGNQTAAGLILTFLNGNYVSSPPTPIPFEYLPPGFSYRVKVTMCNFLQSCSSSTKTVTVLANILPSVTILGEQTRNVFVYNTLSVSGNAFTPGCSGGKSTANLLYIWTVNINNVAQVALQSTSVDPTVFQLPQYQLTAETVYTVTLSVLNTATQASSSSSITVIAKSGNLVAKISGGATRSLVSASSPSPIVLDGSESFDQGHNPALGTNDNLIFTWSCKQTAPTFSLTCPILMPDDLTTNSISVNSITDNGNTVVAAVKLVVTDGSGRVAEKSVSVDIIPGSAPQVSISTSIDGLFAVQKQLTIVGSAVLADDASAVWTVDDTSIDLSAVSYTPVSNSFTGITAETTVSANLVIQANALPVRTKLTFTLTAFLAVDSTTKSSTSIVVETGGPPLPGVFAVTPATGGMELNTSFSFSTDLWSTDNTPLTYEFGFVSASGNFISLQARSEAADAVGGLPAGNPDDDYALTLRMWAYDSLNARTKLDVNVQVLPLVISDSDLQDMTSDQLAEAGDANSIGGIVGTTNEFLNAVNCTDAGSGFCDGLNREPCASVAQTCGPCKAGYYGLYGASNNACQENSRRKLTAASLTCPNDCSGDSGGSCGFRNLDTRKSVDDCTVDSYDCMAVCTCESDVYGTDCSYDETSLSTIQATRLSLLNSLLNMTAMQNVNDETLSGWITQLNSNTQVPDEISGSGAAVAYEILAAIMDGLSSTTVSAETAMSALVSVDRLAALLTGVTNPISPISVSDEMTNGRYILVDKYSQFVSSTMVAGQSAITDVLLNFRVLSAVRAIATGVEGQVTTSVFDTELTGAETSASVIPHQVTVPIRNEYSRGSQLVEINEVVTRAALYGPNAVDRFNSNPLRLSLKGFPCAYDTSVRACRVSVVLQNYRDVPVSNPNLADTGINHTTVCQADEVEDNMLLCDGPLSYFENASCTGLGGEYFTQCGHLRNVSDCAAIEGEGIAENSCTMTNYTATETTCSCLYRDTASDASDTVSINLVSALVVIKEGYSQTFTPYTGAPSSMPSSAPTSMPTQPTSQPTVSSPFEDTLFALSNFTKDECFNSCGMDMVGYTRADRGDFCSFFEDTSCTSENVEDFTCMPACMPNPLCAPAFCASFAVMSQACDDLQADIGAIGEIRNMCLDSFEAAETAAGRVSPVVAFGLEFGLDVDTDDFNNNGAAQQAVGNAVAASITGVTSVTNVQALSTDRRGRRLSASSTITMDVQGIPASSSSVDATGGADVMVAEFTSSVTSSAFSDALTASVKSTGADSIIPTSAITAVSAGSVARDTSVTVEFAVSASPTAVPSVAPTAPPSVAPTTAEAASGGENDPMIFIIIGVVAAIALIGGVVYFMMGKSAGGAKVGYAVADEHAVVIKTNEANL